MPFVITFAGSYPLARPAFIAFLGWASWTHLEVFALLPEQDSTWMNVADQICSLLAPPRGEEGRLATSLYGPPTSSLDPWSSSLGSGLFAFSRRPNLLDKARGLMT